MLHPVLLIRFQNNKKALVKEPDVERCLNWYRTRLEAEHVVSIHALRVRVPPVPFCRDGSTGTASVLKTDMSGEIPAIRVQIPVTAFDILYNLNHSIDNN